MHPVPDPACFGLALLRSQDLDDAARVARQAMALLGEASCALYIVTNLFVQHVGDDVHHLESRFNDVLCDSNLEVLMETLNNSGILSLGRMLNAGSGCEDLRMV